MMRFTRRLALSLLLAATAVTTTAGCGTTGAADAPDIDALRPKAGELTDQLVGHEWKAIRADFDDTMRDSLDEDGLADAWDGLVAEKGTFVERGEPTRVPKPGNFVVFDTPMTFEKGEMKSRVTFHANGDIAGLFVLEPNAN